MKKPELLLPVGNMDMCLSAIHNGADAIYMGSPFFNARGRSKDHSFEEIKEIVEMCHLYGVKVNIAFNILLFQNELQAAFETVKKLISIGVDALIIQDLGLVQMVRMISEDQVIHGSTQMSLTNFEGINLLDDLNIKRFVLGRENTIDEIDIIKKNTDRELEVFVHGALCVSYSGQCFTSESLGGRSANRGQCAQSCRFEYELLVDGKTKDLSGKKFLVSPKDLCGINEIKELMEIEVDSLKVEGRLKSKEFVASVARSYRQAIDKESFNRDKLVKDMASTYSRGFYSGWLHGVAHQELVSGDYQDHRGYLVGKVISNNKTLKINSNTSLKVGDGLLFIGKEKLGSKIVDIKSSVKGVYEIKLLNKTFPNINDDVYINSDEKLNNELNKSLKDEKLLKKIDIVIKVKAKLNENLICEFNDGINCVISKSDKLIEKAKSKASTYEDVKKEVLKINRSVYQCSHIDIDMDDNLFIFHKEIKKVKNQCIEKLNQLRTQSQTSFNEKVKLEIKVKDNLKISKKLILLLRTIEQLEVLVSFIKEKPNFKELLNYLILDYEFGKDFFKSVRLCKKNSIKVFIATTRILKPNEYHNFTLIKRASPDGILVRNLGALEFFKDDDYELIGDFSLNVTNSLTFNYLIDKGLSSLCLSYDMNKSQVDEMLKHIDTSKAQITAYQYMPEFHMEHCVFAAFMSKGNSFRDCGKPCEKHEVSMKDMYGNMHEIKADQECRNTMFKGTAQSALTLIQGWQNIGVSDFRVEFLHEKGDDFVYKISNLLKFFKGEISENDVIMSLKGKEKYGLSEGQLLNTDTYKDIKKDDKNKRV